MGTPLIYHEVVKPIMKKTLNGFNGSIFMYGQTTSGKTYTMLGNESSPGVLPCAIRDIFKGIELVSQIQIINGFNRHFQQSKTKQA